MGRASGAPVVLVVYGHDSERHQQRVIDLAEALQKNGLDCRLDRWVKRPPEGWERWFEAQLDAADVLLIVGSRALAIRLADGAPRGEYDWEARLVRERLRRPEDARHRTVVVLPDGTPDADVPDPARGAAWYRLPQQTVDLLHALGAAPPSSGAVAFDERRAELLALQKLQKDRILAGEDVVDVERKIQEIELILADGPPLVPGDILGSGRYELLERIGAGRFGEVWKAYDKSDPGLVAVKVLRGRHAQDPTRSERFFRGAQEMARLHHPRIVRVREPRGVDGERRFYVMDYAPGGDLGRKVRERRLDVAAVVSVITALGDAIQHAHDRGIVHCNIKPQSVVLDRYGKPLLTDFELAQARGQVPGTAGGGALIGYLAPEALDGSEVDHAADQYSLAMTAAFLLHGDELPRRDAVFHTSRFLRALPCSIWIKTVLLRALSEHKQDRHGSVREFCDALQEAARRPEPQVGDALEAVVLTHDGVRSIPLPKSGVVTLGRAPGLDIRVNMQPVSSLHARLHIGPSLVIEDNNSTNGTTVVPMKPWREGTAPVEKLKRGESRPIELGDVITLAEVVQLIVRRTTAGDPRAWVTLADPDEPTPRSGRDDGPVVADPAMQRLYDRAFALAGGSEPILILGEGGVGKATLAQAIHRRSPRAGRPFLALDCKGVDRDQVARHLFGESSRAIPVAGLLESESTVFLEEIGALTAEQQAELLRALDEGKVLRIGGTTARAAHQRLICSASGDLGALVSAGKLDPDLHRRISQNVLVIPPLRDRREDIGPLARAFAARAAVQYDRVLVPALIVEVLEALQRYRWPGNVHELRLVIERAVALCGGPAIMLEHLPSKFDRDEDTS